MKFAVVVFPGSNCDVDCYHVAKDVLGQPTEYVWHASQDLAGADCVLLPGGFSYGDYLRSGAIAALSPVMQAVKAHAARGGLVVGICNGFQILLESGLLPGAMRRNDHLQFRCQHVHLRVEHNRSVFTAAAQPGQLLRVPIAHMDGNYFVDDQTLTELEQHGQILFRYATAEGEVSPLANPNGSIQNIAGVCNREGNILGMMPHPERAAEEILGSADGRIIFDSIMQSGGSSVDKPAWQQMGLKEKEYQRVIELLGREPNYVEVGLFAVMWSEHCSYKHSRPQLKTFPVDGPQVLQGPGENAGVVDIGEGQAVVFKIESHNHPSAIEPYQGAATGVGGIVRDVFAMGARPIALLDSLRLGNLQDPHQRFLFSGIVAGIAGYGNCMGIPTVAGEVYFNDSYNGNCLVNAMCVGLIDQKALAKGTAAGLGNAVMLVGARTGRDGIHGATFASEELSESSQAKRPSVQVGDPFMEKLLLEACLELIELKAVVGMQDLGAAGLTSSGSEMASRGNSGVELDVALVPRRELNMTPYEVMLSESQERMLVIVQPERVDEVQAVFSKWGLTAVHVGRVTDDGMFRILENGQVVAEVPAKALTDEAPVYYAASERPAWQDALQQDVVLDTQPEDMSAVLLQLLGSPNIASKAWVYQQYDHMVRDNTVILPGSDAAVLRIRGTNKGLAMTVDCNSRYVYLNPYVGGVTAVAEAARNLVCAGAKPLAITNCLNFGSPEKPEIFWQFKEAVRGMGDACRALDTPVTGGNVSFYNEANGLAIYPTPTVGMVGLLDDIDLRMTQGFKNVGDVVVLLGETLPEIGGSEYLAVVHGQEQGQPPVLDLAKEANLQSFLLQQIGARQINSAHDCSEGGLAAALAESAISGNVGCEVSLASDLRADLLLFSESQSRVLISVPADICEAVLSAAAAAQIPSTKLGSVTGNSLLIQVNGQLEVNVALPELKRAWQEAIPCLMES